MTTDSKLTTTRRHVLAGALGATTFAIAEGRSPSPRR